VLLNTIKIPAKGSFFLRRMVMKTRMLLLMLGLAVVLTGTSQVAEASLVAHWKLDDVGETEPNAIDSSGNDYHGTVYGPNEITGIIDEAFDFVSAESDYVDLTAHVGTLGALTQGTITAWVKDPGAGNLVTPFRPPLLRSKGAFKALPPKAIS
jgi:hypothetical protein